MEERCIAVFMGLHSRLGHHSHLRLLDDNSLSLVLLFLLFCMPRRALLLLGCTTKNLCLSPISDVLVILCLCAGVERGMQRGSSCRVSRESSFRVCLTSTGKMRLPKYLHTYGRRDIQSQINLNLLQDANTDANRELPSYYHTHAHAPLTLR